MSDRVAVMNKGAILQIDTPQAIYNHPTHRFVADFIGDINFLDAVVSDCGENTCRADIAEVGSVEFARNGPVEAGQKLTLAIRPERVSLSKDGLLRCKLDNVVYHGTDTIYHLALPNGARMRVREQNRDGYRPTWQSGDTIGWDASPDALAVIADQPA